MIWIRNNLGLLVFSVIILFIFLEVRAGLGERAEKAVAEIKAQIKAQAEEIQSMKIEVAQIASQNQQLLTEVKKNQEKSSAIEKKMAENQEQLRRLEENRPPVPEECREIAEHLTAEIEGWKKQFSLAIEDRNLWKKTAEGFQLAYQNQLKITELKDKEIENLNKQIELRDYAIKRLQNDLKMSFWSSKTMQLGLVAVGALAIYTMIKK